MKPIVFLGRSLEAIREFPASAKRESGYELDKVQRGLEPKDWKAMPSIGPGVREIRIHLEGAWRVVYVANRADAVYVLHSFQKKKEKTSMRDIAAIKSSLKELK
ncbi:MAG: type II toxin-antitoxin system RelE/ParE family toxin [Gammaproteobacteria bacterium]|nr:type II toxin-antitoxin system RelE/ParE family toxin [Gammaproteobacteria bacterium]